MQHSLLILLSVLMALWLPVLSSHAAFILDDFDDPVIVTSPESDEFVTTTGVGPLNAERQVKISWIGQGEPDGQLDANISLPSILTGQVSNLNPHNVNGAPIVSLQMHYSFPSTDFCEEGVNDALFFDFLRLESEIPPFFFNSAWIAWIDSIIWTKTFRAVPLLSQSWCRLTASRDVMAVSTCLTMKIFTS